MNCKNCFKEKEITLTIETINKGILFSQNNYCICEKENVKDKFIDFIKSLNES